MELIDTCFNTHHLQFGFDEDDTLYLSSVSDVIGWVNTKTYAETGDEQASQGWCPTIVDTTGDGRIGEWTGLREDPDPAKDRQLGRGWYGIVPDPTAENVVWAASAGVPGQIVRLSIGDNPPETCISEYYQPPFENADAPIQGYSPRGIDIDRNGVVWTALSGSGHVAKFDRSRCAVLNGPTATGQHCPEGWTLYATPGPQMQGVDAHGSADFHYYNWVDQFDTLGLGENVPHRHRLDLGLAARVPPRGGGVRDHARPLPARVLLARPGRAHRRSRRRLERDAASGPTTARTPSGTSRAARARRATW